MLERRIAVERGEAGEALFMLEHEPVVTTGRNTRPEHLPLAPDFIRSRGVAVHDAERGGSVTYHGPGQLTAYPVLDLRNRQPGVRECLRSFEQVVIETLGAFGLAGERLEGYTGVWVHNPRTAELGKVAAIGIALHNWVTWHGIAINVNPDMTHFGLIIPCGISDRPVTSLAELLDPVPAMNQVMDAFESAMRNFVA